MKFDRFYRILGSKYWTLSDKRVRQVTTLMKGYVMEMNIVTVDEEPHVKDGLLHRNISCTCGWETTCLSVRSEEKARHHLLFTHGEGFISYAGSELKVG